MTKSEGRAAADFHQNGLARLQEARPAPSDPNVVLVLLPDLGFAQLGCYGADIETPNIDRLAAGGVRFQNFNSAGTSSGTSHCLLTGRNHHAGPMGADSEFATDFSSHDDRMPNQSSTLAEILLEKGYATFAVGKWLLTPVEEQTLGSPRQRWPLGRGFERFYGFHGSQPNHPHLVSDNHRVVPPRSLQEGHDLSADLTDKSLEFIRDLHEAAPRKPFFLYLAYGAMGAQSRVLNDRANRYQGRFDKGWDNWRATAYRRQRDQGVIPADAELTPRPDWIPAWEDLSPTEQRSHAKQMETFAGFVEHTDAQVGRVADALAQMGKLDNTVFVVLTDRGATAQSKHGALSKDGSTGSVEEIAAQLDAVGGPCANAGQSLGWAWAGNAPFRAASLQLHAGAIRNPLILHWPEGKLANPGMTCFQFAHAIDLVPTLLEMIGFAAPRLVGGAAQSPMHGVSLLGCIRNERKPSPHLTQYYEANGARGLFHDGWKVVTSNAPAVLTWHAADSGSQDAQDHWELYDLGGDFSEMHDLSALHPERVQRLVERWWVEAGKHNVLPLNR